ncbi:MAG: response regulator [Gammaproteobacteria bacterium]|nr:response regulator [Gammaproteobacteria bacterium]
MEKKRILVVDDDNISRTLIKGFLKNEGNYIVDTVQDGYQCLSFMKYHHVDLIISDIEMDDINGLELSQALLLMDDTANIPVILSSVRDRSEIRRKTRDFSNVKRVVQKPYNRDALLSDVSSLL